MPGELRVGPREIEELEDAERAAAAGSTACTLRSPLLVDQHRLAALDLAHELRADEIERARLGRDDPVVMDAPEHERAEAVAGRGTRSASPRDSATTEYAPSSRCIAFATASSSGASSFAISAAITSLSEVARSVTPSPCSSSRSAVSLTRLPLCPSATVRALPCCTSGCAFDHCDEPVVE